MHQSYRHASCRHQEDSVLLPLTGDLEGAHDGEERVGRALGEPLVQEDAHEVPLQEGRPHLVLGAAPPTDPQKVLGICEPRAAHLQHPEVPGRGAGVPERVVLVQLHGEGLADDIDAVLLVVDPPPLLHDGDLLCLLLGEALPRGVSAPERLDLPGGAATVQRVLGGEGVLTIFVEVLYAVWATGRAPAAQRGAAPEGLTTEVAGLPAHLGGALTGIAEAGLGVRAKGVNRPDALARGVHPRADAGDLLGERGHLRGLGGG